MNDNFPSIICNSEMNTTLTYNGNTYSSLFFYPKSETESYNSCKALIQDVSKAK